MKIDVHQISSKIPLLRSIGILIVLISSLIITQNVSADIFPKYLTSWRTYDQESDYFQWNGSVGYVRLYHKDNTALPPSEGGTVCSNGCYENVTRIYNGGSISGNFTYLKTFNVQLAYSGNSGVGRAVIKACGQTIQTVNLYTAGAATPGFNNIPSPAWNVPTSGDCSWSITATGGYVDFRAVTISMRSTPAPLVDLKVNYVDGPITLSSPGNYTLSWASTNAAACTASGNWSEDQATNGAQDFNQMISGTYTHTLTCSNPSGSVSDSVTIYIVGNPTVSISAPPAQTAPASYIATWSSTNATTCIGADRFTGFSGVDGSKQEIDLEPGVYDYTVTCTNALGISVSETKRTLVFAAPMVDVKVNDLDAPSITLPGPASYDVSWTSDHATQCSGTSRLSGYTGTSGCRHEDNIPAGTQYEYQVTCQNAAGATASDFVTVHIVSPLNGAVTVTFSRLPLYAPDLGLPAQTLTGRISGGIPPYTSTIKIRPPSGNIITLLRSTSTWSVTPENSGDPYFGTSEQGSWSAWAEIEDSTGQTFTTASGLWEVAWYPVHGRP